MTASPRTTEQDKTSDQASCVHCRQVHFLGEHCPSPDEIATACRELQTNWSDSERTHRRLAGADGPTDIIACIPRRRFKPFVACD